MWTDAYYHIVLGIRHPEVPKVGLREPGMQRAPMRAQVSQNVQLKCTVPLVLVALVDAVMSAPLHCHQKTSC